MGLSRGKTVTHFSGSCSSALLGMRGVWTGPMTFDDVRLIALAWPEVEDGNSYGTPALKVRKKMLARLKEDGDSLVLPGVPQDERDMLVESKPQLFYFTDHYRDYPTVLIRLSK